MTERLLKAPGFIYKINNKYYFLGKWICKECTDTDASDCVVMYDMCRRAHEEQETSLYFQKIRAYSDFALEVPCDLAGTRTAIAAFVEGLSDAEADALKKQIQQFEEDCLKYGA